MSDIGQCDSTLHSMWSCRSYVHTSLTFLQAGTNDRDTWIGQTWQADHGVHASPFPPVPKYSCVLTELTIYNDFSHRYPGIDRIVDGIAGPIEEILAVSDIDTAWPQRLNASEVYRLHLAFGDMVDINPEVWDAWAPHVHDLMLGSKCPG